MREHLEKLSGTAFDVAYAQAQLQDHQRTLQLLEYEIGSGQDEALRSFAAESLPQIRKHLEMAQNIAATRRRGARKRQACRPARPRHLPPPQE